jgi:rhamnose utilization protein RhaD (predicted bifunctional aldolase and dehydrogenase)
VNWDPQNEAVGVLVERIKQGLSSYQVEYKAYFDKNKNKRDKISETAPPCIRILSVGYFVVI